ncbi:MAG: TonB-dependent receptor domain-containing protein, partial [Gammaproteobacteria bacterium]
GLIANQQQSVLSTVPTQLMQAGNFSEITGVPTLPGYKPLKAAVPSQAGCIAADGNPANGGAMDTIAPGCIDSVGQKLFSLYPSPNLPSDTLVKAGAQAGQTLFSGNNHSYVAAVPNHTYSMDARIDHTINTNNQLFGRYSYENQSYEDPTWTANAVVGNGNFATDFLIHDQSVAIGLTSTLSAATVNQFHFGFGREYAHSDPLGVTLGQSAAAQYGLANVPVGSFTAGLPPIDISGLTRMGTSPWRPQWQVGQIWQFADSLSTMRGNHSLQVGYEYHRAADTFLDVQNLDGEIAASGIYSGASYGMPDFLLGDASQASFTTQLVSYNYYPGQAWYAQDAWRVTPNLTLTYGLRYELFLPLMDRNNQLSNFSPANGGEMISAAPGAAGPLPRALIHPDYSNFAPRFGFSYHMLDRLVWRGGYGIFYNHRDRQGSESMLDLNPPFLVDAAVSQSRGSTTPVFQLQNGFPIGDFPSGLVNMRTAHIRAQDPYQQTPYVEQASFGPELQITRNTVVDVTAVGNWGRHMDRLQNANQGVDEGFDSVGCPGGVGSAGCKPMVVFPYANLNSATVTEGGAGQHAFLELATDDGNTDYAGLQASLRREFQNGLGYGINYT